MQVYFPAKYQGCCLFPLYLKRQTPRKILKYHPIPDVEFFWYRTFSAEPKEMEPPGAFSKWQPSIGVFIKMCSENMQQIYRKRNTC